MDKIRSIHDRQHARVGTDLYINKIIGDEPHLVRVRDLSAGGMFMYRLLEPCHDSSQPFGMEIMLPGQHEIIWAVGQIVREERRNDEDGYAVRFVRISEQDRQRIRSFVSGMQHAEAA